MAESKFKDVVDLFRVFARDHIEIGQVDGEKHFYRLELDEVLTALPSAIYYPAVIMESYDFDYTDNKSDNLVKNRNLAIDIIDHYAQADDFDAIHNIYERMEAIADDFMVRLRWEKRERKNDVVRSINLDGVSGVRIHNEQQQAAGVRIAFTLQSHKNNEIDPTRWQANYSSYETSYSEDYGS